MRDDWCDIVTEVEMAGSEDGRNGLSEGLATGIVQMCRKDEVLAAVPSWVDDRENVELVFKVASS